MTETSSMTTITAPSRSPLEDPLTVAAQQVAEAEERRDRQVRVVAALAEGTPARTYAEHVLQVMEKNLSISEGHQALIQNLLGDDHLDGAD